MTPTQKRFAEWPVLIVLIWLAQALEVSLLRLPAPFGSFHLPPIIIIYLALTRSWPSLAMLSFLFAVAGAATVTQPGEIYIASQLWTAFATKAVVTAFRLEGRFAFTALVAGAHIINKILVLILLANRNIDVDLLTSILSVVFGTFPAVLLGWFLFPIFMRWDLYFMHEPAESRELNPDGIR